MIIVDVIDQLPTVPYQLATQADLDETVRLVEALRPARGRGEGRRPLQAQLDAAVAAG